MAVMPLAVGSIEPVDKLRAFFSFSRTFEAALKHNTVSALHNLFESLQSAVEYTVHSDNLEEFNKRRLDALKSYAKLIRAISLITEVEIDDEQFALIASDSLSHLQQEFVSRGIANFGAESAERIAFCIFTLRRIVKLVPKIVRTPVAEVNRSRDHELSTKFAGYLLFAHFHLDCMRSILLHGTDIHPSVVDAVLQGLQASSLAYATIREGLELRANPELALDETIVLDEEDQALSDESEYAGTPLP